MRVPGSAVLAQGYLWLMACAAIGMKVYWLAAWQAPIPDQAGLLLLLFALGVAAQHFPVAIAPKRKVDVSVAVYFAAIFLFGAPVAVALVGLSHLVGQFTLALRRNPVTGKRLRTPRSALFNTSQAMVATGLSAAAYYAFVPHVAPAPLDGANAWALPLAAGVMFLANTLAVAVMVGLQLHRNPLRVWASGRRRNALEFAGLFLIGLMVARVGAHDPWIVPAMTLPAAIIYWSMDRLVRVEELARREAEVAAWRDLERMKTDFMRSISHELRAPLAVVVGFADLLRDQTTEHPIDPEAVELSEQIHSNAQLLMRLVDDLLDFSKIERGEMTIQAADFDLAPALQDLLAGLRRQAGGDRLVGVLPESLPVHADRVRVVQAVYNLLANAQKYAPAGPITLRAVPAQSQPDGLPDVVRVEVEDHGPGILAEEQPRVWQRFYRGRPVSGLNVAPGAGIGLAMVKALVEAQAGRVGLASTPGRGARFWIELPAPETSAARHSVRAEAGMPVVVPVVVRLAGDAAELST